MGKLLDARHLYRHRLHDLNRSAYGGDIYINNGSHGCINLPLDVAKKIYDKVTINTPVMIVP